VTVLATFRADVADAQSTRASATPQEVRVISMNGAKRTGRLLSLGTEELTLLQGSHSLHLPLNEVRRVERVTHHAKKGTLIGVALGFALGFVLCTGCEGDESLDRHEFGLIVAGIGAGLGANIGAGLDRSRAAIPLYVAPVVSPGVHVQPSFGPRGARLDLTLGW
jgi:hypothetical protein